jgi:hypothetical protein
MSISYYAHAEACRLIYLLTVNVARYSAGAIVRLLNGYGCSSTSEIRIWLCVTVARLESPVCNSYGETALPSSTRM